LSKTLLETVEPWCEVTARPANSGYEMERVRADAGIGAQVTPSPEV
jgi:hypothetical protein